ncbi:DUF4440 domain-containing protein [Oleiagrimonas sp. MCCC 1A03011]|uniref:YybH family protein n=1 Tax=Oleiagrimonas sp. MCCC 1A03011 TaxID=1926883 RepID=UPI000DC4BFA0|nr:DUF4440 domain-containing protein [Oleiagrimonas sp. MCCC 1A03011]RAP56110.1 hypothetical protein BTJ49_14340 [Oleiagrimonas sp. MCCC 1A03011]
MKHILFVLMAALLCASPSVFSNSIHATPTHEAARRQIQKQFERWVHAFENGDARTLTDIYAPNAILLLPNASPIVGRTQLRKLFDQLCRTKVSYTYEVKQLVVTGPWAYRWGFANVIEHRKTAGHAAQLVSVHLKFIDIWKRSASGTWKIYRDSSVIDTPHHVK